MTMEVFPLPPEVNYGYAQRFGTGPGEHHGTDIMAAEGEPVVAVADGTAHASHNEKGGNVIYLTTPDGWRYYYAHLLAVTAPLAIDDQFVEAGTVIGMVGTTGNAVNRPPHLHFQVSPPGGGVVDPFPLLEGVDPKRKGQPKTEPDEPSDSEPPESVGPSDEQGVAIGLGAGMLVLFGLWWLFGGKRRG